jgi:hypothetical protein
MNDNYDRAGWAEQALTAFRSATRSEYQDVLADLLCDLIHWADREGVDFEREFARACGYYRDEVAENAPCKPL